MPPRRTKPGTAKLSEVTRHLVQPTGIAASGWPQVEKRCGQMGIGFDEWQRGAGRLILAKTRTGQYAATVGGVGMSLPRQVGKTYLIGAIVFALSIDTPGLTVIWTAHHSRTAGETFLAMQGMAKRAKIAPHVKRVLTGANTEAVEFHNGSRILFGARERGFGRGFAGVDILVCDEAQILTDKALDNMLATMNTARNALPLFMGTPPRPTDPAESFIRMRADALSGQSDDTAWIECGADPGADPDDRKQWAKANPSFPHRTPATSLLRLRKKLKPDSWLREGLGIWDEDDVTDDVLPGWGDLVATEAVVMKGTLGVACDAEETRVSAYWVEASGEVPFIKLDDTRPWVDRAAFAAHVADVQQRLRCEVHVRGKSALLSELEEAGVNVTLADRDARIHAASDLALAVQRGEIAHGNYPELNAAVSAAAWKVRDGRRVLVDLRGDLEAASLAHAGASASYDPMSSIL